MTDLLNRYPMMKPYVGKNYIPGGRKSLLLIGESHYLPDTATQNLSAESWYSSDFDTLKPRERQWISTSDIITCSRAEGFKDKAHSIYKLAFQEINAYGPQYSDYREVADDIVYYNYFQRPAREGLSLVVSKQDVEVAENRFLEVVRKYRPAGIVFLSTLAYNNCSLCGSLGIPVKVTPHPGCAHWNTISKKYGGKRGRDILGESVKKLWFENILNTTAEL